MLKVQLGVQLASLANLEQIWIQTSKVEGGAPKWKDTLTREGEGTGEGTSVDLGSPKRSLIGCCTNSNVRYLSAAGLQAFLSKYSTGKLSGQANLHTNRLMSAQQGGRKEYTFFGASFLALLRGSSQSREGVNFPPV